jgi:putative phage-type endonuclease
VNQDRSTFLGGSDAAAVMGLSPWKTPVELWLEKTGQAVQEPIDPVRLRILERGKKLEPVVLEMVMDKLRERGHQVDLIARNQRYQDPEHAFMSCEIDFEMVLDGETINGDCKTVHGFARKKWGDEDTEEVPIEYAAQFMHGLMITGRKRCLVAALIGLDDVGIYWVNRDDETIAAMRDKELLFWNQHVLQRVAPDPLMFDDIKLLYPSDNGQAVQATEEIELKVLQLAGVRAKLKVLEEREESLKFDIAEFISPHAILTSHGSEIASWKGQQDTRLDQKALQAEMPDVFEKFKRTKTIRVLRLKKGK